MSEKELSPQSPVSRRNFIKGSAAVVGTSALGSFNALNAHAQGSDTIKIALVGCGGRGTGAAVQLMNTGEGVELVTVADAFMDKAVHTVERLKDKHKDKVKVTQDTMFDGFDAYKKAIDTDGVNLVVLATPPGFRPPHLDYAVKAGKHVFMEKPVAVDAPGVRSVLASTALAKKNNTLLQVGLQRRHENQYKETIARLQDGAIGNIHYMRAFWNGGGVWVRPRTPEQTEMEYQMRNWYYFVWLCGDHVAEQHIHNLDVINWLKDGYPVEANAQGGRQVRTGKDHGEIFDHFFVEYKYADGTRMYSQCRHIKGCFNSVSEHAYGDKGHSEINRSIIIGDDRWRFDGKRQRGHQQEQTDLVANLRAGHIVNEGEYGAKSTMTSILGRMAAYSGKVISWDDAINSNINTMPEVLAWDAKPPTTPGPDGTYPIPIPGVTRVV